MKLMLHFRDLFAEFVRSIMNKSYRISRSFYESNNIADRYLFIADLLEKHAKLPKLSLPTNPGGDEVAQKS